LTVTVADGNGLGKILSGAGDDRLDLNGEFAANVKMGDISELL